MARHSFHPAVAAWFEQSFDAPTAAQLQAWPAIQSGRHALVAAPTGSGKTLAAFLAAIDALVRRGIAGALPDETSVVYVSPLKALSNDIRINLEAPLQGIRKELEKLGLPDVEIRSMVRTGDTPQADRQKMRKRAPHIVVTTPESLYILLGSESGRRMLSTTTSVIVDEIHALAAGKRGSHLALSLERLDALCGRKLTRIGLSATQKPIEEVGRFLTGGNDCEIVDVGHSRKRDLGIEVPPSPLEAVMSNAVWEEVYDRLAALASEHRTTLIFVNTRRMSERAARHLSERLGKDVVAAHHGSLAREHRLDAEQRLKRGELRALVATASLELGIDIGDVDLVCQIGSPRSIAAFLQRAGRSGHAVGATPKARLFPQSRDELVECAALLDAVRRGELDRLHVPAKPLDVLAQQIVAEVACGDWNEDALYELVRRAWPFRDLTPDEYRSVVRMLAEGYSSRMGVRGAYLHRDAVNRLLKARRGARLTAVSSGGTIPDTADYEVVLEPQALRIGTVHEDFAVESLAGDIFQLGNLSYRILRVERGRVRVEDAKGAPPSIPFWLGEAPGRSDELSAAVSRLRSGFEEIVRELPLTESAARQLTDYLSLAKSALGTLPTHGEIVLERFFDESGGTQLIVHSPYGSRINRAWGLALRKRFCVKFNFELQAAATEDAIVLSLSTGHSFPLEEVARYLHSRSVRDVLVQALLAAPMFAARWRWNATTALALPRMRGGKKVAPQLQRMVSEDLLASVFPDSIACAENIVGEREVPEHPLIDQTIHDCLTEAMDIEGLEALLRRMESGEVRVTARDTTEPSPLAMEVLSARPYAYLDDAPLEERRTQAVSGRRWLDADSAADLGRLDAEAIAKVKEEAAPLIRNADELHEALMQLGFMTEVEVASEFALALRNQNRAIKHFDLWIAAERLPELQAIHAFEAPIQAPAEYAKPWAREDALVALVRGRLSASGPVRGIEIADALRVPLDEIDAALAKLEAEGTAMRGHFTPGAKGTEWCDRRLLARIHRYTVKRLRAEIEPVEPRDFMRFLFDWQRAAPNLRLEGPDGLAVALAQLEGFEAPAAAWESELLPARVAEYDFTRLDELCLAGRTVWARLSRPAQASSGPVRTTPIALMQRRNAAIWASLGSPGDPGELSLSSGAQKVLEQLQQHGASFFDDLVDGTRLLRSQLEEALGELVALGLVNSDSFGGLRALLMPSYKRANGRRRGIDDAGRWSALRRSPSAEPESVEHIAWTLLRRYGVVCWRLLEREADWLPAWRNLLRVYHRLEARGEIRGGRFIAGVSGEQFALPDAIGLLRKVRKRPLDGTDVCISGADPLNLVGGVVPGERVPRLTGSRLLFRDGVPIATLVAGEVKLLQEMPPAEAWTVRNLLLRERRVSPPQVTEAES